MSDDDENKNLSLIEKNAGGWVQIIFALIKKLPFVKSRIAKRKMTDMEKQADTMIAIMEKHVDYNISWKKGNLESISHRSEEYMSPDGRDEKAKNINQEWAATFADKCGNISDEYMQARWAKILASEVDTPGTFSKKHCRCLVI